MSVPLGRRNLLQEKAKLILSVAGIAAALTLIALLLGFRNGLYVTLTAYLDHLGSDLMIAQSGVQGLFSSDSAVPLDIHDELVGATKAEEAGHIVVADNIFVHDQDKTPVLLVGYDPKISMGSPWNLSAGREIRADDEILLDTWLAQDNGIVVGDRVQLLGRHLTVVGLTRETSSWMSPYVFVSLDAAGQMLGLPNTVSFHLLRLPDGGDVRAAARAIERRFGGVQALTPDQMGAADRRVLAAVMDTPLNVMLVIGLVIGVAVIGLTTYTAVLDRRQEYGVLKALGADGKWLHRQVLRETFARALVGFTAGSGLSYATAALIMRLWPQFTIVIRAGDIARVGVAALFMTMVAALLPIRRVIVIDPVVVFKA